MTSMVWFAVFDLFHPISPDDFALRRTIQPYFAQLIVFGLIAFFFLFDALRARSWTLLEFAGPWCGLFIVGNYDSTRYRVFWNDGEIKQVAMFGNVTLIKPSEITRIALETSDVRTMLSFTRPLRRIAIYAASAKRPKWIDVSLKHFAAADICKLMQMIHEQRPDLAIPKNWL